MGISLEAKLSKKHMNKRDRKKDELVVRKNHRTKFFSLFLLYFPVRHNALSPPVFRVDQ